MTIPDILIIGAVGTTKNIIEQIIDARENYNYPIGKVSVLIDSFDIGTEISGAKVVGNTTDIPYFLDQTEKSFIFSLHKPEMLNARFELLKGFHIPSERFYTFVHPLAYVSRTSRIGSGSVVLSNSTIQSGVTIGKNCIINSNVTIEHDSKIRDFNFIAANACIGAEVNIGDCNFIGLGTAIRENIIIGNNVFVGMHSLVLRNEDNCRIAGVPARHL